ncbi:MAG: PAS domain S-box protein [Humidesulfovibrio sp.]|uniref:PAS domain S-box protein n=1 Tax=Humidesulfovibrio sp. TaxID=2910988 RepID=UPI002734888E|nr:PAS domain S-box protein [Humidesulfovibrio sp.]MDP2849417.1 PAS domain S-box protein [Humidesulfovibrio sp.]
MNHSFRTLLTAGQDTIAAKLAASRNPRGMLAAAAFLLICLGLTLLGWHATGLLTERLAKDKFVARSTEIARVMEDRLGTYEMALRGGQAFVGATGNISRGQWRDYVAKLNVLQNYPGIQGLGYSVVVPAGQRQKHIDDIRRDGFPEYSIRPAGEREFMTAIIFLEPFDARNQRAFGFDMFSEPTRRAAMERTRDTGQTSVSGKVTLVQETGKDVQAGFLMYLPVYAQGSHTDTLSERRAAIRGFVYSPFRMKDFMQTQLGASPPDLSLEIHDGTEKSDKTLLYRTEGLHGASPGHTPLFVFSISKEYYGHTWTLSFSSLPALEATIDRTAPRLVLVGGACISLLLFFIALTLLNTRSRALALADAMTADLRESEERTRVLLDSTGEPIYGIGLKGECTFCNTACLRELGYATPQDLLGRNMHTLIHHTRSNGAPLDVKDCHIFQAFIRGEGTHSDNEAFWRADNTSFPVEYWSYPQRRDGKIVGAVVVFQNITERKRAEADSAKLAGLVNAAGQVSIIATDPQGLITVFNRGAENMLGYKASEMVGLHTPEILHLKDEVVEHGQKLSETMKRPVEGFETFVAHAREGGHEMRQWTYVRKDGRHISVELVITAIRDKEQRILGFLGIAVDISTRVQAEKALRQSEQRFRNLLDLSPVGIFETDADGNCLFVNKRWQEFSGLSLAQAVDRGWLNAIHPEDTNAVFSEWIEAAERNRDFSLEYRFLKPDGKTTWLTGNATAWRDDTGEVQGYFGTVMDIGKRIQAEKALRESKARLSAVLETAVDPILTINHFGHIRTANSAARSTFGYTQGELEGKNVKILMPEPYHSQHDGFLARYRETNDPHILGKGGREVIGKRKDGTIIPLELSVSEFFSGEERIFTGILRDISDRVRAREALENANTLLIERQARLDSDMEAAGEIQRSLLPKEGTCSLGMEMDFRFMPSATIGGDIFNVVCLGSEHSGLYMMDVSGHGVPAALVSVSVAQEFSPGRGLLMDEASQQPRAPEEVLRRIDMSFPLERFDKFFSMFYMLYEMQSGTLSYCNAGHPAPMLLRAAGGMQLLEDGGTLVGLGLGDSYERGQVQIQEGDLLLIYTDGVSELESPMGEQFGTERLESLLQELHDQSPEAVLQTLTGKLQAHADGRPPDDDISLVCVRFSRI